MAEATRLPTVAGDQIDDAERALADLAASLSPKGGAATALAAAAELVSAADAARETISVSTQDAQISGEVQAWQKMRVGDARGAVAALMANFDNPAVARDACDVLGLLASSTDRVVLRDLAAADAPAALVHLLEKQVASNHGVKVIGEDEEQEQDPELGAEQNQEPEQRHDEEKKQTQEEGQEEDKGYEQEQNETDVSEPTHRLSRDADVREMLLAAFVALGRLARFAGERVRVQVAKAGSPAVVLKAMATRPADAGVQEAGCRALERLARWRPKRDEEAEAEAAAAAVAAAAAAAEDSDSSVSVAPPDPFILVGFEIAWDGAPKGLLCALEPPPPEKKGDEVDTESFKVVRPAAREALRMIARFGPLGVKRQMNQAGGLAADVLDEEGISFPEPEESEEEKLGSDSDYE
eukprot:TRINITY_DN57187_c0_g1_i1.p1 TRINITY_DN57187_c0_g1~~TRINITY_DN57187_c0_g1_i1.p1  ORF type:complete len:410 (-),score=101.54 TRINITY_DN57187_c0_g1_i1:164-1393(-)